MPSRDVVITIPEGLHARPAAEFCQAAKQTGVAVSIGLVGGEPVSAASILSVLTLGARQGDTVVLSAEGEGAEAALDRLAALLGGDQK